MSQDSSKKDDVRKETASQNSPEHNDAVQPNVVEASPSPKDTKIISPGSDGTKTATVKGDLRNKYYRLVFLLARYTLILIIVIIAVVLILKSRRPTRVEITLTVDRMDFTAGNAGSDLVPVLDRIDSQSVAITRFNNVKFSPSIMQVADPAQYNLECDSYPNSAWKNLKINSPVMTITGQERVLNPRATLEVANPGGADLIKVEPVTVKAGARVILEVVNHKNVNPNHSNKSSTCNNIKNDRNIDLKLNVVNQGSSHDLAIYSPLKLTAEHCNFDGITGPANQSQVLTYKVNLAEQDPIVRISGSSNDLGLAFTIPIERASSAFTKSGIVVLRLNFTHEVPETRGIETSLVPGKEASIGYPDYPEVPKILFRAPTSIVLGEQDKFTITEITLKPDDGGIYIELTGTPQNINTGLAGDTSVDLRLSLFDMLWQSSKLKKALVIVVAAAGALGFIVNFVKDIKDLFAKPAT